jgi:hypothetical protein
MWVRHEKEKGFSFEQRLGWTTFLFLPYQRIHQVELLLPL